MYRLIRGVSASHSDLCGDAASNTSSAAFRYRVGTWYGTRPHLMWATDRRCSACQSQVGRDNSLPLAGWGGTV